MIKDKKNQIEVPDPNPDIAFFENQIQAARDNIRNSEFSIKVSKHVLKISEDKLKELRNLPEMSH